MLCQSCFCFADALVCEDCRRRLIPAPERVLAGGIRLIAAFQHSGSARVLVHRFKYQGAVEYADLAARVLAGRVPSGVLIPIPRVLTRRFKYGVDPARNLASAVARRTGAAVRPLLRPPLHRRRRAGGDHSEVVPHFRLRGPPPDRVVLVDDVVTTGATMLAAAESLGPSRVVAAVSANSRNQVSSHPVRRPITP